MCIKFFLVAAMVIFEFWFMRREVKTTVFSSPSHDLTVSCRRGLVCETNMVVGPHKWLVAWGYIIVYDVCTTLQREVLALHALGIGVNDKEL